MGGWNLPDDWGAYYQVCHRCGQRYHLSGSDVCDCRPCDGDGCHNLIAPREVVLHGDDLAYCEDCIGSVSCSYCGEVFVRDGELINDIDLYKYGHKCYHKHIKGDAN